jgi:hypothetical protein
MNNELLMSIKNSTLVHFRHFSSLLTNFFSTTVECALQIHPLLQNKPNFRKSQMNKSNVLTRDYKNKTLGESGKNKAKTNPTCRGLASGEAGTKPISPPPEGPALLPTEGHRKAVLYQLSPLALLSHGFCLLSSARQRDKRNRSPRLLIDLKYPWRKGDCLKQMPVLKERSDNKGHFVACWKC